MRVVLSMFMLMLGLGAPSARAVPLVLCYENAPQAPWTMPDGTGLNFELLERIQTLTGERFVYAGKPWQRCLEEARAGVIDGLIGSADSPARREFSRPPLRADGKPNPEKAMYQDRVNVFLRVGGAAGWDGHALRNPRGVVIAQRGYFVADLLRAHGQRVQDNVKSAEEGLRQLAADSADVAVLQGRVAEDLVHGDPRFHGRITMARMPYVVFPFFLMITHKTYAADPKRIEAIWSAIASARLDPAYRKLEAASTPQHED